MRVYCKLEGVKKVAGLINVHVLIVLCWISWRKDPRFGRWWCGGGQLHFLRESWSVLRGDETCPNIHKSQRERPRETDSMFSGTQTISRSAEQMGVSEKLPQDLSLHLQLNKVHPQYAARCKILMSYRHLNMASLHQWDLKYLPLAVAWFERAKLCTR